MPTVTLSEARSRAQQSMLYKSASSIIAESMMKQLSQQNYDVFLSHSFADRELVIGLKGLLEDHKYTVYVDWFEDPSLDRSNITAETIKLLRGRMNFCKCLFYSVTPNSEHSNWMPWECGYMDGKTGRSAIFPLTTLRSNSFSGREYLQAYPYVTIDQMANGSTLFFVRTNSSTYCSLDHWLKGNEPFGH